MPRRNTSKCMWGLNAFSSPTHMSDAVSRLVKRRTDLLVHGLHYLRVLPILGWHVTEHRGLKLAAVDISLATATVNTLSESGNGPATATSLSPQRWGRGKCQRLSLAFMSSLHRLPRVYTLEDMLSIVRMVKAIITPVDLACHGFGRGVMRSLPDNFL